MRRLPADFPEVLGIPPVVEVVPLPVEVEVAALPLSVVVPPLPEVEAEALK
jgi:hypothetical protein